MFFRNPRKFSLSLALVIGGGFVTAMVLSLCFDFGNGDFVAGIRSTSNYLTFFGIVLIFLAVIVMAIAFVAGRLIGIAITTAAAFCLFVAMVVSSSIESQPMSRFRKLIWKDPPSTLLISDYEVGRTFSDGSTHKFVVSSEPQTFLDLCNAKNLSHIPSDSAFALRVIFEDIRFPGDSEFFWGNEIEAAYAPSTGKAYIATAPHIGLK